MCGLFAGRCREKPSVFVERNIALPAGGSETSPGPVSFKDAPYWREILDCLVDPSVVDVIILAPTRMGKTFLLRMVFAYVIAVLRVPMLWYDATVSKAISISKKELRPMIERNKVLRDRKPANPDDFANQQMLFPAAHFEMFGANSDSQASGETAAVVVGNELGKWRAATEKEASILEQTRHRTESFEGLRKHFYSTTPTIESSAECVEHDEGDRRKFFVPCPHCGEMQDLVWGGAKEKRGVKWSKEAQRPDESWDLDAVAASVRYHCINAECETPWTQAELRAAVLDERAEWRPTAEPKKPRKRSYHINGLYGPRETNTMAALAQSFLSSRKTAFIADRRDFWNAGMGMPWVDDIRTITVESFSALEGNYLRGERPDGFDPDVIILSVDCQSWGFPWKISACGYDGGSYTIDWGVASTPQDLESIQRDYSGSTPSWLVMDIRYAARRAEVLQAIYDRRHLNWVAFQGEDYTAERVRVEAANPFAGGKLEGSGAKVVKIVASTYDFKIELEARYSGEMKQSFFPQLPFAATNEELQEHARFYKQLKDERRVPRKKKRKGLPADEFKARTGNNHWFDCAVMELALLFWLRHRRSKRAAKKKKEVRLGQ